MSDLSAWILSGSLCVLVVLLIAIGIQYIGGKEGERNE